MKKGSIPGANAHALKYPVCCSSGEEADDCVGEDEDGLGVTALMNAARGGQVNVVRRLLRKKGADMRCEGDEDGRTPLMLAAEEGHAKVVRLLLNHPGGSKTIDAQPEYGSTALALAAERGHEEVVEELLRRGADIHKKGKYTWSPFAEAVYGEHEQVARMLLNHGAVIGDCPQLLTAVSQGHSKVVELFLRLGANKDQTYEDGLTPLMYAASEGNVDTVKLLLGVGANVRARDAASRTALMQAIIKSREPEIAGMLLQHMSPEDIDSQDKDGWTALHHAAGREWYRSPSEALVRVLLEHGANPFVDKHEGSAAWEFEATEQASDDGEAGLKYIVWGLIRQVCRKPLTCPYSALIIPRKRKRATTFHCFFGACCHCSGTDSVSLYI